MENLLKLSNQKNIVKQILNIQYDHKPNNKKFNIENS